MKRLILFSSWLLVGFPLTGLAASNTPLMVVRFNTAKVQYQRSLHNAVSKAVAIKPSVAFEVVSFAPKNSNEDKVEQETSGFVHALVREGIPSDRVHVSEKKVEDSPVHELYLYVD